MWSRGWFSAGPGLKTVLFCLAVGLLSGVHSGNAADPFLVGVGIGDVTGPTAELGMMGYASATQTAAGLHIRLFARAFIFDANDKTPNSRVVFVSADLAMIGQAVKLEVVRELSKKYGDLYTSKNVLISATHTHSGPAGYMQYALYGISSYGFLLSNFRAVVDGIVESIDIAHRSMQPANLSIAVGRLDEANKNRSPTSYLANPPEELLLYADEGDTDKNMTLLRIKTPHGDDIGTVNWFAVHPTSMNNTNRLISGDNKGYASMHFEYLKNVGDRPGKGKFVAAFASSNLGDVSPNIHPAMCVAGEHAGENCETETSTCGGYTQNCISFGPGKDYDMEDSCRIIGERQLQKALELYSQEEATPIYGTVGFAHQYINMSNYPVTLKYDNGTEKTVNTCPGALGFSFAGGTTDGPGAFDFTQGDTTGNPFWELIRDVLHAPTRAQLDCHFPKPILLDVGETHFPYDWVPSVVETQVLKVGNLYIVGMPGELTTMSGRRLRRAVQDTVQSITNDPDSIVVIAGLSNVYTHYVATFEEYQKQRYEAASTLYGPHTLSAYMQQFSFLASAILKNESTTIDDGPTPPLLIKGQISLNPPIILDMPPFLKKMGDCVIEPYPLYYPNETVKATFVSGHPRNNPMRGGSFFIVEKLRLEERPGTSPRRKWDLIATDADWNTKFKWGRPYPLSPTSEIDFIWDTENSPVPVTPGVYRIRHFGYYKPILKSALPYDGSTQEFEIREPEPFRSALVRDEPKRSRIYTSGDFWKFLSWFKG